MVSSKGKLYRRTFSENKKLYPVNPIFYDLIIDEEFPIYTHIIDFNHTITGFGC